MRRNRILIVATLFLLFTVIRVEQAAPQDPKSNKPADKTSNNQSPERVPGGQERLPMPPTELVSLPVTVTDLNNRLMTGLGKQHFEVYDNKVKQEISFFSEEDAPVNMGIVFDVSGSMKGKIDRAREALKAFIHTSHSDDDFFLIGFNQRANLLAEFTD